MSPRARGVVAALAAVVLFGSTVVLQGVMVADGVDALTGVGLRYGVSALVCAVVLGAARRPLRTAPGEGLRALALGGLVYALQAVLFYLALGHGSAGAVSMLFYTYPVGVLVVSIVLRLKPFQPSAAVAAALCAGGAGLIVTGGRDVVLEPVGAVLALASSACTVGFLVANNRVLPRSGPLQAALAVSVGVAGSTLALAAAAGTLLAVPASAAWAVLASGAATGAGTALMYVALAALQAPTTSVVLSLQTVVATAGAAAFLGQPVVAAQVAGGAAILLGVALAARGPRSRRAGGRAHLAV